jgi:hypothetical protein
MSSTADVAQCAVDHIGRHLGVAAAGYGELGGDGRTLRVVSQWSAGGASRPTPAPIDIESFGERDARHAGLPIVIDDTRAHDHAKAWIDAGIGAIITAPQVDDGRTLAMLWVSVPARAHGRQTRSCCCAKRPHGCGRSCRAHAPRTHCAKARNGSGSWPTARRCSCGWWILQAA